MRIGIEARRIFRPKKHGLEIALLEMLKALQVLDQENEYFIFAKPDSDLSCITFRDNFKLVLLPSLTELDWEQVVLPSAVKKYKIDLLHCTSNTAPVLVSVPLILTLHDIIYYHAPTFEGSPYQIIGNAYRRFVVPFAVKNATHIFTVSSNAKEQIKDRFPVANNKISVNYNGINPAFKRCQQFKPLEIVRLKYNLPETFIFFIGNDHPRKNAIKMIEAYCLYCQNVKNPLPLVCPNVPSEMIMNVLEENQLQHLWQDFIQPEYITFEDLPLVYNLAELFVFPSLEEGFGLPIIESMACGTPVITSNISCMPEVSGAAAKLVDPHSIPALAEAMEEILKNQAFRNQLISAGLQRSRDFSWQANAENLLSQYLKTGQQFLYKKTSTLTSDYQWK
ncbi:glycosyltransferase family 1 protein [Persicobacter sp. CCB-QB2]|uniref:glycosyltransferase family 4 protein n=1 Tax=Persicobacter sp. CCB-QB2 TaxID=1561025 RepID=UPI0006A989A0|nr:glycosyltransferase family 1 protein [Persicobacter sp. CCB-QB2]